jgi:uncharacterized protein YdeI (YjbR/CyaY-like superfamily)
MKIPVVAVRSSYNQSLESVKLSDNPKYFETANALRDWYAKHAQFDSALAVGFFKTSTGVPSVTLPESIDEALCVGWVEVLKQSIDDKRYMVRFVRRKQVSVWTELHLKRIPILCATGRMKPAGLAVFKARKPVVTKR